MEKKDWRWRLYKLLVYIDVDCGEQELGFAIGIEGVEKLEKLVERELDKAREDGYQDCMDDIWEEAKGLRSWTEHDGSVSSADIEAGLQEAYLNIENKLNNK